MSRELHTKNPLRCFCSRKPLLATYGVQKNGKAYVHIKVYKQSRIFGNMLVLSGVVALQCRECFRWHQVRIAERGGCPEFAEVSGVALSDNDVLAAVDGGRAGRITTKVGDRDE